MGGKFLSIGECMVELSQAGGGLLRKGFAGDTFNTAWYARAAFPAGWSVDYFTALGDDPLSDEMAAFMEKAGIGTGHIARLPGRTPGLYLISLKDGERSFSYWRDAAAARTLADDADRLRAAIDSADSVYFSGITLAILSPDATETLLSELRRARAAGKQVAYDPNIRLRLWASKERMLHVISEGARAASIVLPGFDDEAAAFGDSDIDATIARYKSLGVENIVLKNGAAGVTLDFGGKRSFVEAQKSANVVDTTSAGDSFNGAFLPALLAGKTSGEAAAFAASVAATVIGHHGALIDPGLLPTLA